MEQNHRTVLIAQEKTRTHYDYIQDDPLFPTLPEFNENGNRGGGCAQFPMKNQVEQNCAQVRGGLEIFREGERRDIEGVPCFPLFEEDIGFVFGWVCVDFTGFFHF